MSNFRQDRPIDPGVDIRTFAVTFTASPARAFAPPATPGWHQLIHLSRGAVTVRAANHDWLVIPQRGLWIPSGVSCSLRLQGEVALRALYVRAARSAKGLLRECAALNIAPLLRELILRAASLGALDRRIPEQRRLIGVIRDELRALPAVPLQLPIPADERAARFAAMVGSAEPCRRPPLAHLFRRCGSSQRTMERLFRAQTSMSLGRWIRRHDLLAAAAKLASGERVSDVSDSLGYNSPSAFIAMFKRELGQTPASYAKQLA